MSDRRVVAFVSAAELGPALAHLIASRAEKTLSSGAGYFSLGLSGGSLVSILSKELPVVPNLDCSRWLSQLFSKLNIPEDRVLVIDPSLPVQACAEDYASRLRKAFDTQQTPVFDMLLLGMGPDGHTCSLFPDHPLLQEKQKTVAPISDSPKPPPQRVTLTLPVVNAAHCVVFVSTGSSKAPVLKQVLEGGDGEILPAALVSPTQGELFWLVDEPAAASLTRDVERPGPGAKL
ncbi:6-phosphogluconolactonase [Bagarius yarrelli]|uniref:6-phosphogluconolactonase n=1 Tax=Bagarius yarrelli TaxID=175774 RepID=A0A556VCZ3_BAGYA|nr:6-phosphogluconolactonase [Bagarius yarrelli]